MSNANPENVLTGSYTGSYIDQSGLECGERLILAKHIEDPKTRDEWKIERSYQYFHNPRKAEWINRKILYPIGNIINGKYPGDEEFKCSKCRGHVAVKTGIVVKCVDCGECMSKLLSK